jgi:phosphoribosylformimino-5-aminoimidazole carboxamide ribotide isomerase
VVVEVIPEIEILRGHAVLTSRSDASATRNLGNPIEIAERLVQAGAQRLHVIDVGGAIEGRPSESDVLRGIAALAPTQLGGGLRTAADIQRAFDHGVDRVVIGSAAVDDPDLLRGLNPSVFVVAVDVLDGHVAVHGRADVAPIAAGHFIGKLADAGVERVLITNVARQGTLRGPDLAVLTDLAMRGVAVQAHGGVASLDHLSAIGRLPAIEGIVVGRALHEGLFTYNEALLAVGHVD